MEFIINLCEPTEIIRQNLGNVTTHTFRNRFGRAACRRFLSIKGFNLPKHRPPSFGLLKTSIISGKVPKTGREFGGSDTLHSRFTSHFAVAEEEIGRSHNHSVPN